jgi:hypothetical protein
MKTLSIIFVSLFALAACNNDGSDKKPGSERLADKQVADPIDSSKFTTVQWLDTLVDIGKVKEGEMVNVVFRFKNTGDQPLVVESAHAGCGCTVPERPEEPVLPSKEGHIKAVFNSRNQGPEVTKNVTVIMNTKPERQQVVVFKGIVEKNN